MTPTHPNSAATESPAQVAPVDGGGEPDELTRDEILHRAKALLAGRGVKRHDRVLAFSVAELMADFGMELSTTPATDRCGHPDCGCDPDASCAAALSATPASAGDGDPRAAMERAIEAEQTLAAWFDVKARADTELAPAFKDALAGYLRTSRSGGMPAKLSDQIEAVLNRFIELQGGLILTPIVEAIVKERLYALTRPAPQAPAASAGGESALPANWLSEDMRRVDLDIAAWPAGLRESFEQTHGAALAPTAKPEPAGREEIDLDAALDAALDALFEGVSKPWHFVAVSDQPAVKEKLKGRLRDTILDARPVAEGVAGWRPIETAPKEQQPILLALDRGKLGDIIRAPVVGYWRSRQGWVSWEDPERPIDAEPTHWMKLPKPPATAPATQSEGEQG